MDIIDIVALRAQFISALHESLREAEVAFDEEYDATTRIQTIFRGWRVRSHLAEFRYYAREVQRVFRGHLARKRARLQLDGVFEARRQAVRHFGVSVIQRHFRGWYSRKHVHDFYARKAYILAIMAKGEALRAEIEAALAVQLHDHLEKEESKKKDEFDTVTRNLHHLVSTKAQAGVYNPPWAADMNSVPSAFGVPLETHLRLGVLRQLRTNGLYPASRTSALQATLAGTRKSGLTDTIDPTTGALMAPTEAGAAAIAAGLGCTPLAAVGHRNVLLVPSYVGSKRSLQASVPYGEEAEANKAQKRHTKYNNLDQKPFLAGTKVEIIGAAPPLGINASLPYFEPHILERGLRELEPLTMKHLRMTEAPFVPASSRASRLFEETERRRVAQAVELLANVTTARAHGRDTDAMDASATAKGSITLRKSAASLASKAGTGSSAVAMGISPTRTVRQGHVVAVVSTDPPEAARPPFAPALGGEAATLAVGSGAAAARRVRRAAGPVTSTAGITSGPSAPHSSSTLLPSSRGPHTPFAVTVTRRGGSGSASELDPVEATVLGLDERGLMTRQPGTAFIGQSADMSQGTRGAAGVPQRRPARPLMKPPHVVQAAMAHLSATKSSRLAAAIGSVPLVQPGPEPSTVELEA